MKQSVKISVLALTSLALAGCQGGLGAHHSESAGVAASPVRDNGEIVKAADWSKMTAVTVEAYDYGYEPRDLKLKAGQPYKLTIRNTGSKDHYYTATEFYQAIATRKAMVNKFAEIKAPYFTAIEVLKNGGSVDLYLVPVVKGAYKVFCPIDDHQEKGSQGTITIE